MAQGPRPAHNILLDHSYTPFIYMLFNDCFDATTPELSSFEGDYMVCSGLNNGPPRDMFTSKSLKPVSVTFLQM